MSLQRIIFLIFFSFALVSTSAQTSEGYFNNVPVHYTGLFCNKIIDAGNGSFYLVGTGDSMSLEVVKCDSVFNILSDNTYSSDEWMLMSDAIITSDSGLLVTGVQILNQPNGSQKSVSQVFKFDSQNNIEWAFNELVNSFCQYNCCYQFNDSVYFLGGSFLSPIGEAPYYVAVSKDGTGLWGSRLDTLEGNVASIVSCNGGGYAMIASSGCIVKFDSLHNPLWKSFINYSSYSAWFHKMIATSDGGFLAVGMRNSQTQSDGIVVKVDSNGVLNWNVCFDVASGDVLTDVIETADGGFMVVGGTDFSGFGNSATLMAKLESDGNPEWFRSGRDTCILKTVRLLSNGNYQVAGNNNGKVYISTFDQTGHNCSPSPDTGTFFTTPMSNNIYTTYVDTIICTRTSNGKKFPGSFYYTDLCSNITSTDIINSERTINVYPNPATNTISFELQGSNAQILIEDLYGKIFLNENIYGTPGQTISISIEHLKSSVYLLKQLNGEKIYVTNFIKIN